MIRISFQQQRLNRPHRVLSQHILFVVEQAQAFLLVEAFEEAAELFVVDSTIVQVDYFYLRLSNFVPDFSQRQAVTGIERVVLQNELFVYNFVQNGQKGVLLGHDTLLVHKGCVVLENLIDGAALFFENLLKLQCLHQLDCALIEIVPNNIADCRLTPEHLFLGCGKIFVLPHLLFLEHLELLAGKVLGEQLV